MTPEKKKSAKETNGSRIVTDYITCLASMQTNLQNLTKLPAVVETKLQLPTKKVGSPTRESPTMSSEKTFVSSLKNSLLLVRIVQFLHCCYHFS